MRHHLAEIVVSLVALGIGAGCSSSSLDPSCTLQEGDWGPAGTTSVEVETVVTGLRVPWGIAFLPSGALLVTERDGALRLVRGGTVEDTLAQVEVAPDGEGGLLGIALDPDFMSTRAFFIYFTSNAGGSVHNRVERWVLAADERTASFDQLIVDGIPAARFHNGGRLRIGPDNKLYVGTGDARVPDLSQDGASLAGKLLRFELDGSTPSDNPFGTPVYMLGIRNTQGFDWRADGTLVVTDHGPSGDTDRTDHDEVNIASAGDNLGWPTIYACEAQDGLVSPSLTFDEAVPPGGAAIYTGTTIEGWRDTVLVGSLGAEHLHRVSFEETGKRVAVHETYLLGQPPDGFGRLREVVMGPDGHLYVTTSNCDGRGQCPDDADRILRLR